MSDAILSDLEKLHVLRTKLAKASAATEEERRRILKPVAAKLDRVNSNYENEVAPLLTRISSLEEKIKAAVVEVGATIKTDTLMAVYIRPAVRWDGKKLDGYALAHPDILGAKSIAESGTVQIRGVR